MLIVRRIGIRSYLRAALPATLVVSLLYLTFYNLQLYRSRTIFTRGGPGPAMTGTETGVYSAEAYGIVAIYLTPILTMLLWAWLFNSAGRLTDGLKLQVQFDNDCLTVTRIDLHCVSRIAALVAIPLAVAGVFVEAFATGWLAAGPQISFDGVYLEFAPFVLNALIQAIAAYVSTWLLVWIYNQIAVLSCGFEIGFCKYASGRPALSGLRVTRSRLVSAMRFGILLGLPILLFRFGVSPLLLETFNLQELMLQFSPVRAHQGMFWAPTYLQFPGETYFHGIHLFAHAHTLLAWPLWALIYNFLALRNGGLELEVEGELPAPAPAPAPAAGG